MSTPLTTEQQRLADRSRLRRALNASLGFVLLLAVCFAAQHGFDVSPLPQHGSGPFLKLSNVRAIH